MWRGAIGGKGHPHAALKTGQLVFLRMHMAWALTWMPSHLNLRVDQARVTLKTMPNQSRWCGQRDWPRTFAYGNCKYDFCMILIFVAAVRY